MQVRLNLFTLRHNFGVFPRGKRKETIFSRNAASSKKCINISNEVRSLTEKLKIRPEGSEKEGGR